MRSTGGHGQETGPSRLCGGTVRRPARAGEDNKLDVPPILSRPSSVSQALRTEAGPGLPGVTRPCRPGCDETKLLRRRNGLAHSPCSRLHARPAGDIAAAAGGLLPHRFSPDGAAVTSGLRRDCFLLRL